jgi:putative Mg2+ transporter-C (MgtC) family protein
MLDLDRAHIDVFLLVGETDAANGKSDDPNHNQDNPDNCCCFQNRSFFPEPGLSPVTGSEMRRILLQSSPEMIPPGQTPEAAAHRLVLIVESSMPPALHWTTIGLRLLLTVLAGGLLGADRSRNGHPAGLRTVLLVTLAASVAMIQANLLIPTNGKPPNSYVVMDLMRLPLGILTGVGFIGAGAIVRRGDIVLGITTAATLWFATVVGLCLGGGQLILGSVAAVLGYFTLTAFRSVENRIELYQPATLVVVTTDQALTPADLRARLDAARFHIRSFSIDRSPAEQRQSIRCEVRWPRVRGSSHPPGVLDELQALPGILRVDWRAVGTKAS